MRPRLVVLSAVLLAVILSSPAAIAKGPGQGVIEGPGLTEPLQLHDPESRTIGPELAATVQHSGFLPQLFGADDEIGRKPPGKLGPRYTITYTMNGPGPATQVTQYVYPVAAAGPVTYMPPRQPFWGNGETGGGWYIGGRKLSALLESFGIRPTASADVTAASPTVETSVPLVVYVLVAAAALMIAAFAVRRSHARRVIAGSLLLLAACTGAEDLAGRARQEGVALPKDPCALVTAHEVEAVTGERVIRGGLVSKESMRIPGGPRPCDYVTDGRHASIGADVSPDGAADFTQERDEDPRNTIMIGGLGDEAFATAMNAVYVRVDGGYFVLATQLGAGRSGVRDLRALAALALRRVDPASFPPCTSCTGP